VYLILTASKDAYITNKIISGKFRATDANVGRAGTIDIFKLYDESTIAGESLPVEVSRGLIKFEYDTLRALTSSILDINSPSFRCSLRMYDALGTQTVPRNFNLVLFPLSQSFDEGDGRDVGSFADLDVCNFVTASYSNGTTYPWFISGANSIGLLGSSNIDVIGSGSLGAGVVQLGVTQNFSVGTENLEMDITPIVSATLAGLIPDCGFRLSFTGAEESDTRSRFVKRFGSRHSRNVFIRPAVHVSFDDVIHDNHESFVFDVSGSLFLSNYHRSLPANILSGTSLSPIVGPSCMKLRIQTGSFSKTIDVDQHTQSTTGAGITGLYEASFALSSADQSIVSGTTTLRDFVSSLGSVTFDEIWGSNDGSVGYHTSSITIVSPTRTSLSYIPRNPVLKVVNLLGDYIASDSVKVRVFGVDTNNVQNKPAKSYRNVKSEIFEEVYYRVVDTDSGSVVIPYARSNNATRCSTDSEGMFFNFKMSALYPGRVYHFEFLVIDRGIELQVAQRSPAFRVNVA
jgi:hypothetical protein